MAFKIMTLSMMALFYGCYFWKLFDQQTKGIRVDQLGKGKIGFVRFIEIALKTVTCLLPVLQVICIVFYCGAAHIAMRIAGVVLTMLGVLAFILSVLQMKENWRAGVAIDDDTKLVTSGIYAISRNPAFLGFDLMYIGILCTFFNWVLCLSTAIALMLFHLQIVNVEEDFLSQSFGAEYVSYKKKVSRYIGKKNS